MVKRVKDILKLRILMLRMYLNYGLLLVFRKIYNVKRRKCYNVFDAIVEIRPDLRNELTEKFF